MSLADTIESRRLALGMSRPELAALVGVNERQIRRWEASEQEPTASSCAALARSLGLTLPELFGEIPIGLDMSGQWFAAWDTSRNTIRVVDRHTITATHRGAIMTFAADGDYLWSGDLRIVDGSLMGTYLATEADRMFRGSLYFAMSLDRDAAIGRWSGLWADGLVGGGWGVLAREESRAGALLELVMSHEGPLTEWPKERE